MKRVDKRRRTSQLDSIRAVFERVDRPIGPGECHALARKEIPRLGIATVYRNVRRLMEEGWLRRVELPGSPDRYERAGKRHHHHFHCRVCDGVYDLPGCPLPLPATREVGPGFIADGHEVTFFGTCPGCTG